MTSLLIPASTEIPSVISRKPKSQSVCSLVYSPPGTKLQATVHTANRLITIYKTSARVRLRAGGQDVIRSIISGHKDMEYTANNRPPTTNDTFFISKYVFTYSSSKNKMFTSAQNILSGEGWGQGSVAQNACSCTLPTPKELF